ncbi:MAG TPA: serine hydrolase domain-containing protein [Gammaproteobacteria bacterium]|nr:serine hydrolase domain-containing protein [Gammaproteobacteria bacterium]
MKTPPLSANKEKRLHSLMDDAYIPGLTIATIIRSQIKSSQLGVADTQSNEPVNQDTQFWACSLSKPVFAFLIITLIQNKVLPTQFLDEALPWDENILGKQGKKKSLTPGMILSHQTGLQNSGPTDFKFNPGEGFRYSGDGYIYLQKMLEEKTGETLESLAQRMVFEPLKMTNTSFLYPNANTPSATAHDESLTPNPLPKMPANNENAAASLHTTAVDYAKFLLACIQDANFIALITPQIHDMKKDVDAKEKHLDEDTLNRIDWGLGFGLEKNQNGEVVSLFHWGHGPGTRAFFNVKISNPHNPSTATGFVYLTNSENGLAIANEIGALTSGDVTPIMRFLSLKYDYKDIHTPHWHDYHNHMIAAKQAENNGDYASAMKRYQQAMDIRPDKQAELRYRIFKIEIHQLKKEMPDLALLTGQYGPIQITQKNSRLQINDGDPDGPRNLETINNHLFLDGAVILDFKRQPHKKPTALSCFFPNGDNPSFNALTSTASIAKTMGVPAAALLTPNEATPEPTSLTANAIQPDAFTEPKKPTSFGAGYKPKQKR